MYITEYKFLLGGSFHHGRGGGLDLQKLHFRKANVEPTPIIYKLTFFFVHRFADN